MVWGAKQWLVSAAVVAACVFGVSLVKTHIKNEISKNIQEVQENNAKEIADSKLKCENEKNAIEVEYKKEILELKLQLDKAKILLEKVQNQKKYSTLIKQDVKKFMNEMDILFGIKGKQNENK